MGLIYGMQYGFTPITSLQCCRLICTSSMILPFNVSLYSDCNMLKNLSWNITDPTWYRKNRKVGCTQCFWRWSESLSAKGLLVFFYQLQNLKLFIQAKINIKEASKSHIHCVHLCTEVYCISHIQGYHMYKSQLAHLYHVKHMHAYDLHIYIYNEKTLWSSCWVSSVFFFSIFYIGRRNSSVMELATVGLMVWRITQTVRWAFLFFLLPPFPSFLPSFCDNA